MSFIEHIPMYHTNGGTVIAIGGKGYGILGASTMLCCREMIQFEKVRKVYPLSDYMALGIVGFGGDVYDLTSIITMKHEDYKFDSLATPSNGAAMTIEQMCLLISHLMRIRRSMPYFVSPILCGINPQGNGIVYTFNAVGHYRTLEFSCAGAGSNIVQPLLEKVFNVSGNTSDSSTNKTSLPLEAAKSLIIRGFSTILRYESKSAHSVRLHIITESGVHKEMVNLTGIKIPHYHYNKGKLKDNNNTDPHGLNGSNDLQNVQPSADVAESSSVTTASPRKSATRRSSRK